MLGKQCKDKITGFSGIAIGEAHYLFDGVTEQSVRGERAGGPQSDQPNVRA